MENFPIPNTIENNKEVLKAPEGWKTSRYLAEEFSVAQSTVQGIANKYRESNSNEFKEYKSKNGSIYEFYSPEIVNIIKYEINKISLPPEGSMTNGKLATELGVAPITVKRIANKYRESNSNDFVEGKIKGHIDTYYTSNLISIIKDEIKKTLNAPENSKTARRISSETKVSHGVIKKIAERYRVSHPEYFRDEKNEQNRVFEHYSEELVKIITEEIEKGFTKAPKGWQTNKAFSKELNLNEKIVSKIANSYRSQYKDFFGKFKLNSNTGVYEHYSPEILTLIKLEIEKEKEEKNKELLDAPDSWKTRQALSRDLLVSTDLIKNIAQKYKEGNSEYFKQYKNVTSGEKREHYSPELVEIITNEVEKFKAVPEAPEGWLTNTSLAHILNMPKATIKNIADLYRVQKPDYYKILKMKDKQVREHYSPELVEVIANEVNKFPKAEGEYEKWQTKHILSEKLGIDIVTVEKLAYSYGKNNPEYFKSLKIKTGSIVEHYSPELIQVLVEEVEKIPEAPEGWKTNRTLADEIKYNKESVKRIADRYRQTNPEYFKEFKYKNVHRIFEHYSPELSVIIAEEINKLRENKTKESQGESLKEGFENLAQEIGNEQTTNETAKKIAEIIRLLPGNAHDIILKYHPQYKGLKPEYVKQIIADYLGDFMLTKNKWEPRDLQKLKEVADIEGIKEEILINLKNALLTFINTEKRNNTKSDEFDLVEVYFNKEEIKALAESNITEVNEAISELKQYYEGIFEMRSKKPANIIETLKNGRTFPDINQLVNIQEIKQKKKMLIADEMGLGKSASIILAKEYLGLKCALVVAPSNVEATWKKYLSDETTESGKQIGYFKNNQAPKVLVIESPKDAQRLTNEVSDYIIISQEKISSEEYKEALQQVDLDMMIVDEVHKLKNIESGVRSKAVEELANKIEGDNNYLALLSGTPIPNKVKDIAISLKLLYPEKYKDFDSKEMVKRILYGDLIDLRSELLQRMQMKELATSIEMPPLTELDVSVELKPEEREIYDILLEEDELTALDKIMLFRQFLLNPELLNVEPGFMGSKVEKLSETLTEDLKTQNKIVVFVNGYIKDVIHGDQNIIDKLNLPSDVIIEKIYGDISQEERKRIEQELKSTDKKTVLLVSGQTADVGVDFSGADGIIFYNEPWSNYEKYQQRSRVYREGLEKPLTSKTLITKNSIEEGIRNYSNAKEKAIQKLLKGIANTDAEKKLLYNDSKLINTTVETNAELSKEYLSDWEKLMMHFGEGFESGEKRFRQELTEKGKEYAELYKKLGRLTYQGNNARVTATLLEEMIQERNQDINEVTILDIASGPEMLKDASREILKERILSMDINAEHFADSSEPEKTMSASYLNIPRIDNSVDYVNLGFAFHQTSPIKYYKKNYERLQVLAEMNRVLKTGGRAVISMLHNVRFSNQSEFNELVSKLGFKIVPEYNGEVKGGQSYKAHFLTLEKVDAIEEYTSDALKAASADNERYITELGDELGRESLKGLAIQKTSKGSNGLRDQRRMIDKVIIQGKEIDLALNDKDRDLFSKEVQTIKEGEELREKYGGIKNIPIEEIKKIGFERKVETPGYYLLYKIIEDGGAVIIRGDYKSKKK